MVTFVAKGAPESGKPLALPYQARPPRLPPCPLSCPENRTAGSDSNSTPVMHPFHHTPLGMAWQQTLLGSLAQAVGGKGGGGRALSAPVDAHAS